MYISVYICTPYMQLETRALNHMCRPSYVYKFMRTHVLPRHSRTWRPCVQRRGGGQGLRRTRSGGGHQSGQAARPDPKARRWRRRTAPSMPLSQAYLGALQSKLRKALPRCGGRLQYLRGTAGPGRTSTFQLCVSSRGKSSQAKLFRSHPAFRMAAGTASALAGVSERVERKDLCD